MASPRSPSACLSTLGAEEGGAARSQACLLGQDVHPQASSLALGLGGGPAGLVLGLGWCQGHVRSWAPGGTFALGHPHTCQVLPSASGRCTPLDPVQQSCDRPAPAAAPNPNSRGPWWPPTPPLLTLPGSSCSFPVGQAPPQNIPFPQGLPQTPPPPGSPPGSSPVDPEGLWTPRSADPTLPAVSRLTGDCLAPPPACPISVEAP